MPHSTLGMALLGFCLFLIGWIPIFFIDAFLSLINKIIYLLGGSEATKPNSKRLQIASSLLLLIGFLIQFTGVLFLTIAADAK